MYDEADLKRLKLKRKRRKKPSLCAKELKLLVIILAFGLFFAVAANSFGGGQNSQERLNLKAVKIGRGDTLWKIAKEYAPPGSDYRRFVSRVTEINNLDRSCLYQDEVIYVPVCPAP